MILILLTMMLLTINKYSRSCDDFIEESDVKLKNTIVKKKIAIIMITMVIFFSGDFILALNSMLGRRKSTDFSDKDSNF